MRWPTVEEWLNTDEVWLVIFYRELRSRERVVGQLAAYVEKLAQDARDRATVQRLRVGEL